MASQKKRATAGRGLFYTRDSGGKHETTPGQYLGWAQTEATRRNVRLSGTSADIEAMFKSGEVRRGDLFFDVDVSGNQLNRPALNAMLSEVERDLDISHVFIPRRDRLARPNRAEEGMALENRIRELGVTIVFQKLSLAPLKRTARSDVGEAIQAFVDYDASGKFRDDHAEKMIWAKMALAQKGYSTGGRPPFGFRRFLVGPEGQVARQLEAGEKVRLAGHHVAWLPGPKEEIDLIFRVISMLETTPATRVAKILTAEGIPAPDANRTRRDNGISHVVRGVWHQTTIVNIARNPLLRAMVEFGRRAMGDRRRLTPDGPRLVEDEDRRSDGNPKVVQQPRENRISAKASFEPLLDPAAAKRIDDILDARGQTQRGKPRSRDPERNPLGGRIYDMACSWRMYRAQTGDSFDYRCGLYQQSDGARCRHNRVKGPPTVQFVLEVIRQKFEAPDVSARVLTRLEERLRQELANDSDSVEADRIALELSTAEKGLSTIERNLAFAENDAQRTSIRKVFNQEHQKLGRLKQQLDQLRVQRLDRTQIEQLLQTAKITLARLPDLAKNPSGLGGITSLFQMLNVQLYLKFDEVKKAKRTVNVLTGGVVTIGSAPAPIQAYTGPTDRRTVKNPSEMVSEGSHPAEEDESLRNESRGDRI